MNFCQAIKDQNINCRAYGVDTWLGDKQTGPVENSFFEEVKIQVDNNYASFAELLKMTFDAASERFEDGTIDLLHIDGYHVYEVVKHDYETWLPKMSARGVILFHDTIVKERNFGVWKLWDELTAQYPSISFQYGYGLGVLFIGKVSQAQRQLINLLNSQPFYMRLFQQAGYYLNEKYKNNEQLQAELAKSTELTIQIANEQQKSSNFASQLQSEQTKSKELTSQFQSENAKANELANQLQDEKKKSDELTEHLHTAQIKNDDISKQLQSEQAKANELTNQLQVEQVKVNDLAAQVSHEQESRNNLVIQLQDEKKKSDKLTKRFHAAQIRNDDISKQFQSEQAKANELANQLQDEKKKSDELTKYLHTAQAKNDDISKQLQSEQAKVNELVNQLQARQVRCDELTWQLQLIQSSVSYRICQKLMRFRLLTKTYVFLKRIFKYIYQKYKLCGLIFTPQLWRKSLFQQLIKAIIKKISMPFLTMKNIKKVFLHIRLHGFRTAWKQTCLKPDASHVKVDDKYKLWIEQNEPGKKELAVQRQTLFPLMPKISLVVPADDKIGKFLSESIISVLNQTYSNWELCIVAHNIKETALKGAIESYMSQDNRIRSRFTKGDKEFANNVNEAISAVTGDFVIVMEAGATLSPFALFEVVKTINQDLDVEFIYSDEDRLSEDGQRRSPIFKPDWSPDTLRSNNYIKNLSVIKRSVLDRIKWFREDLEGSYQYDLLLRATEKANKIIHIPKILYHERAESFSTTADMITTREQTELDRRVLSDHLKRIGVNGTVENGVLPYTYKVVYKLKNFPLVSIIIPNRNHIDDLSRCINSIMKSNYKNFEIIIIENGSSDPETFKLYDKFSACDNIRILKWDKTFNYSSVNNHGAKHARGEILLFLNNDVEAINDDWLSRMVEYAVRKENGVVGAKLFYSDGKIQHGGIILGVAGVAGYIYRSRDYLNQLNIVRNVSAVTGACMMMRKEIFLSVNGFDERFVYNFGDVDICVKIKKKGYLNIFTPFAVLYHNEGTTRKISEPAQFLEKEINLFKEKWAGETDPYLNKNFPLTDEMAINDFIDDVCIEDKSQHKLCRTNFLKTFKDLENFFSYSIVILNKDKPELIRKCIEHIRNSVGSERYEIIIGDTGSTDPETLKYYEEIRNICKVAYLPSYHFSKNNNELSKLATMNFLLFLNNDVFISKGFLSNMGKYFIFPNTGIVGPKLLFENGKIQHVGIEYVKQGRYKYLGYHPHKLENDNADFISVKEVPSVTGACLMIERNLFHFFGGFDETYQSECQDSDLCLKVHKAKYKIICDGRITAIHLENGTRPKNDENLEDRQKFVERWKDYLQNKILPYSSQSKVFTPRVLFVRHRERGDVLASTAVVREFKNRFPTSKIYFETKYKEIVESNRNLEQVVWKVNYDQYDCIVYLLYESNNWDGTWLQTLFKCAGFRKNEITNDMQYPDFFPIPDKKFEVQLPKNLIVIGPNAGWPQREWLHESWVRLSKLLSEDGFQIAQVGSVNDPFIKGCIDLRGISFNQLGILMSKALLFAGADSFPMHMALALLPRKENMVLLTCPTSKDNHIFAGKALEIREFSCPPCRKKSGEGIEVLKCNSPVIKKVPVDTVHKAITRLLQTSPEEVTN